MERESKNVEKWLKDQEMIREENFEGSVNLEGPEAIYLVQAIDALEHKINGFKEALKENVDVIIEIEEKRDILQKVRKKIKKIIGG